MTVSEVSKGTVSRVDVYGRLLLVLILCNFISELFEVFDQEPVLWCVKGVALAVLATYTWSFMQFTLVFTATAETVPDDKKLQTKVCNQLIR